MPSITGYTASRTQAIEDAIITSAAVVGGHLIFTRHDGSTYDAGDIRGGEQIPHTKVATVNSTNGGTNSSTFVNFNVSLAVTGFQKYRSDTKIVIELFTGVHNNSVYGSYVVGVLYGSTTVEVFSGSYVDNAKSGCREVTGLAAGTYTFTAKKRRGTDAIGTVNDGYIAKNSLKITETF